MATEPPPADDSGRPTRAEQQRRTRDALVASARRVFAREGFHGASLETVAREAGLSKGAVYSNFAGKAALFLAVMDDDLSSLDPETWDPIGRFVALDAIAAQGSEAAWPPEAAEARGFGLATFEFMATAARDPAVGRELAARLDRLLGAYRAIARRGRSRNDPLGVDALAAALLAFDQGVMGLALAGMSGVDADAARRAFHRLLRPGRDENGPLA